MAAYLYFRKDSKANVVKTRREADAMLVDFNEAQEPIGIEFIAPSKVTLGNLNQLLASLGQEAASVDELWPLINRATQAA